MFDLKLMTSWNSIFIHSTEIEKEAYFIHIKTIQIANLYVFPDHKRTCFWNYTFCVDNFFFKFTFFFMYKSETPQSEQLTLLRGEAA
jgi:hypothetical protein